MTLIVASILAVVLLVRNTFVLVFRVRLVARDVEQYLRLEDRYGYTRMVLEFWRPLKTYLK